MTSRQRKQFYQLGETRLTKESQNCKIHKDAGRRRITLREFKKKTKIFQYSSTSSSKCKRQGWWITWIGRGIIWRNCCGRIWRDCCSRNSSLAPTSSCWIAPKSPTRNIWPLNTRQIRKFFESFNWLFVFERLVSRFSIVSLLFLFLIICFNCFSFFPPPTLTALLVLVI